MEQQQSEQVYRDFETALWKALKDEGLQVGKTTGGNVVLGAPDPLAYWPRIAKDYHNRYLAVASDSVGANAQDSDHAFAFYVTLGSCTPGVAFCISVHRWRRKAGSSAPPKRADSRAMDEPDWVDTLVPWCVLHVRGTATSKAH